MTKALGDTGPILHLHEIARLDALGVFAQIELPARVALELERLGLPPAAIHGRTGGAELVVTAPRAEQSGNPAPWVPAGPQMQGTQARLPVAAGR